MYDVQAIQDEFMGLVGLRQTSNPIFDQLPTDLVKSSTNVLIQHPLLNIENLDMTSRNYGEYDYDTWEDSEEYDLAERVKVDDIIYESQQAANENHAVTDTDWWMPVSLLALYLEDVFRNSIDDVLVGFVNEKKLRSETKTILDNVLLYEGMGNRNDLIVNEGYLVGFAFQLKFSRNLLAMVKRIGHQFSQTGDLTLWIYHSSQAEAIATVEITRTKANGMEWTTPATEIRFRHFSPDLDAGGVFFIMYDQDSIPGQAINKNRRNGWDAMPCGTCSGFDKQAWRNYSKFMTVKACRVKPADRLPAGSDEDAGTPDALWDVDKTEYVPSDNYGLNFELMARCDLTDMLIQHKDIFAMPIRDMVTVKLLESLANSTRQNGDESKVGPKALIALQSSQVGGGGMREIAAKQIKAIDFEFSGFSDVCLPCKSEGGLKYGSGSLQY